MNLSTRYLGLDLKNPLIPGASPLTDTVEGARRLEDAGAPALVLRSLFEEQIERERTESLDLRAHEESFAEALTFFPAPQAFAFGPDEYLEHLRRVKVAVSVPVIASLNGATPGGWLEYARLMQHAGADAIELNLYRVAFDPDVSSLTVEREAVAVVREVVESVGIPVAVKLSPFYSSLAQLARQLDEAGASALVLFNRFYQPDIDPETLDLNRSLHLSDNRELPLRLRWLGALSGVVGASLAASGGVHSGRDAIKAVMAGASAVQIVSALLRHGPGHLQVVRAEMEAWMREFEWDSLEPMRGNMSLKRCPDPTAYERANYVQMLQAFRAS
jgi:dihydroorotate dehydrogenase (fumarate)